MRRIETLVALAACACLCAALSACAAAPVAQEKPSPAPEAKAEPAQLHPDFKEAAPAEAPLREGKEEVTVLVLNGCGIEGAAEEAAEQVRQLGFENVTVDNALRFNYPEKRVSFYYEENRPEAEEIAALLGVTGRGNVYCYDGDEWAGAWSDDYDICVMIGDPSVRDNIVYSPN